MSTPAPVAADPHFGWRPSLMIVLAHRPGRNWQSKPAGICWGSAGPWLWRAWLPAAIYYWPQVVSFPPPLLPQPRTPFYRLSAGLIRADMLNVLGWADVAIAGVCVFLLWQSGGSGWRVVYYKQHGDGIQKHIYAIFTKFLDWDRNTASWAMTRRW